MKENKRNRKSKIYGNRAEVSKLILALVVVCVLAVTSVTITVVYVSVKRYQTTIVEGSGLVNSDSYDNFTDNSEVKTLSDGWMYKVMTTNASESAVDTEDIDVPEHINIEDYLESYNELPKLLDLPESDDVKTIKGSESYGRDGFYIEWKDNTFSILNCSDDTKWITVYGLTINDNGDKITEVMLNNGWVPVNDGVHPYYYATEVNGQKLGLSFNQNIDKKIISWTLTNDTSIEWIAKATTGEDALRRAKEGLYLFDIYVCDSDGNPIQQSADVSLANVDGTKYDYSLQRDENGDILCYRFEVKAGEYWYSVKIDGYVDDTAIVPMVVERDSSMTIRLGKTSGIIEY